MKSFTDQASELDKPEYTEESAFYRLIGHRIKSARAQKKLLQIELATMLDMSQSSLTRMETGETQASLYDLVRIARVLKIKLSELIPKC